MHVGKLPKLCAALCAIVMPLPKTADASVNDVRPVLVQLDSHGCWTYQGRSDGFLLRARHGERFFISASGVAGFRHDDAVWTQIVPRDFTVTRQTNSRPSDRDVVRRENPNHTPDFGADGSGGAYVFDTDGQYNILLMPASIEGSPSQVDICRAPPGANYVE